MIADNIHKPCLLIFAHLPPPINGVTLMSQIVASSEILRSRFKLNIIPITSSSTIADIGQFRMGKVLSVLKLITKLGYECLKCKPDLIYFTLTPNGAAFYRDLFYVAVMKMFGIRRVYHIHGKGIIKTRHDLWSRILYRWVFRGAYVILLSSRFYKDYSEYVDQDKCFFLQNGIPDPHLSRTFTLDKTEIGRLPHILYLSNMILTKGPLVLLQALEILKCRKIPFRASFAGAWSKGLTEELFMDKIASYSLEDMVSYCGPCYDKKKESLLTSADILAFPTSNDSFPLVILEGMSHGLPIVSTFEGAIPDMVQDGKTGFLVKPSAPKQIAERLMVLINDMNLGKQMGRAGRVRFKKYFTHDIFQINLLTILEKCIELK